MSHLVVACPSPVPNVRSCECIGSGGCVSQSTTVVDPGESDVVPSIFVLEAMRLGKKLFESS